LTTAIRFRWGLAKPRLPPCPPLHEPIGERAQQNDNRKCQRVLEQIGCDNRILLSVSRVLQFARLCVW
jgi:hypothetical protein